MAKKKRREGGAQLQSLPLQKRKPAKRPHECDHDGRKFTIRGKVDPVIKFDKAVGPSDPNKEVVGHCLVINVVECDECGQVFRFLNLPTVGNPLAGPMMRNQNLTMHTPIEPDSRIVQPDGPGILVAD